MRWLLAWHIIFMVAWFAGLFYLPRLYVYHSDSQDVISLDRFKIMEYKLFYYIMTPAALLTTLCGLVLLYENWGYYQTQTWMQVKLGLVVVLWAYHIYCGYILNQFRQNKQRFSAVFYRWFNEIPTVLLIGIVLLIIIKPD